MRLTWPGRILLLAIVGGIAYGWIQGQASNRRVSELAALEPCELALSYFEWRVEFESGLAPGQTSIEGDELRELVRTSRTYRDAIQESSVPNVQPLTALHAMVRTDADPDAEDVADFTQAASRFGLHCPSQANRISRTN